MVRRCICEKHSVNGLVDAVLFTAHTYHVPRELRDSENMTAVLTEFGALCEKLDRCIFQRSL